MGIWVGSGSRDEMPNEHGISHMLEHMAFKGTKRRSARQIAEEKEAVAQYGSSDSGASLGDILGAALKEAQAKNTKKK